MLKNNVIYLDNAATTPLDGMVLEGMLPFLKTQYGNPSSLYSIARDSKKYLDASRESITAALNARSAKDILFTSGATEANNWAIKSIAHVLKKPAQKSGHIITSQIEHAAILEVCEWLKQDGFEITALPVDTNGFVSPDDLECAIRPETILISIMHANNEMGAIQDIAALGNIAKKHGVLFHTDAVQTVGKLPIDVQALPIDLLSCSAHKLYGPKGIGFLYANETAQHILEPLLHGGGQEYGLRSGTENLANIVGLTKALELAVKTMQTEQARQKQLQQKLIEGIFAIAPEAVLNGPQPGPYRLANNINFSFGCTHSLNVNENSKSPEGEALVLRFDLQNICVSSGSACKSSHLEGSHVLYAMHQDKTRAKRSIRFSLGKQTTETDIDLVLEKLPKILQLNSKNNIVL